MEPVLLDVQLDPPVGTCYFKSYKHSLSGDWLGGSFFATVDVTFYIYVTLVKPTEPDFTEKGGKVYIIAVYSGSAGIYLMDFGIEVVSGELSLMDQQPNKSVDGDGQYSIDLAQNMSMYNNGGNGAFNFDARYKRIYSLLGFSQSKYRLTSWSLKSDPDSGEVLVDTYGLQIFETNQLGVAKLNLFFIMRTRTLEETFIKEITLDFSAETMADAVVGGNN